MNRIKKYSVSVLLVFALLAINGSELFHHHSDIGAGSENHCPVCILVKSVHNSLAAKSFPGLPEISNFQPYIDNYSLVYQFTPAVSHGSRAPPYCS